MDQLKIMNDEVANTCSKLNLLKEGFNLVKEAADKRELIEQAIALM
jgi:hypothetical protein